MALCSYICQDGGAVGVVDFTKLLFALSSLSRPFTRMRSIPEHVFVTLSQRKACAGSFREETAGKRTGLCYHFALYQTNESCSQGVSKRMMLLISFNKYCLRVTAPNVTEAERPFYDRSQR